MKNIDKKTIAKQTILTNLKIENSLADILRVETKVLRKKLLVNSNYSDLNKFNNTIKYVLYILIILDERMQECLDILENNDES